MTETQVTAHEPIPFAPVRTVLISHAAPADETNSPYKQLEREFGLQVQYRTFVHIEPVSFNDFRKQNIAPLDFNAIVFTSKFAIDHYFRLTKDFRIEMPADTKYFCMTSAIAKYLQKYIVIRKRKLFVGEKTAKQLTDLFKKHNKDKFLFPCGGDTGKSEIIEYLETHNIKHRVGVVYKTLPMDLSDLNPESFDMICFFTPSAVDGLLSCFPDFKQGDVRVAVFGAATAEAAKDAGLRIDVQAPRPGISSMTMAIEHYIKEGQAAA